MTNYDHLDTRVTQKLLDQQGEINDLTAARDGVYRERAQLLAWLAALHPAVIAPALDLDEAGWWLLYITTPAGQLTWHISPRDAGLLAHVERVEPDDPRAQWDGHTTEQKYQRIRSMPFGEMRTAAQAPNAGPISGVRPYTEITVDDRTPPRLISTQLLDDADPPIDLSQVLPADWDGPEATS